MLYHVHLSEQLPDSIRSRSFVFVDIPEDHLRERIVSRWDAGEPITYDGTTVDSMRSRITLFETEDPLAVHTGEAQLNAMGRQGVDVTNDWITGPPGSSAAPSASLSSATPESVLRDHRRVMVVHGRNLRARDSMFVFLRALGLDPIEWEQAVAETGTGSPHNLDAVRAAMDIGQAVVVILTAEDQAGLLPSLADAGDDDVTLRGQPRQNVILEAGLAMGIDRDRVILVELGAIRRASDFDGLNAVRLSNAAPARLALRTRLATAGCAVAEGSSDWTRPEAGGDFESVIAAEPDSAD